VLQNWYAVLYYEHGCMERQFKILLVRLSPCIQFNTLLNLRICLANSNWMTLRRWTTWISSTI
jgi:hypothetical protein